MDLVAWGLGDPGGTMQTVVNFGTTLQVHPMKGPFTTRTLRGLAGTNPLHWRGDIADFIGFNASFTELLGGTRLSDSNMAAYEAFINTIAIQPNPNQNLDRTLATSLRGGNAVTGQNDFLNMSISGSA